MQCNMHVHTCKLHATCIPSLRTNCVCSTSSQLILPQRHATTDVSRCNCVRSKGIAERLRMGRMRTKENVKLPMHSWWQHQISKFVAAKVVLCEVLLVSTVVEHHNCSACGFELIEVLLFLSGEHLLQFLKLGLHSAHGLAKIHLVSKTSNTNMTFSKCKSQLLEHHFVQSASCTLTRPRIAAH
jgi:hypothetical protein